MSLRNWSRETRVTAESFVPPRNGLGGCRRAFCPVGKAPSHSWLLYFGKYMPSIHVMCMTLDVVRGSTVWK